MWAVHSSYANRLSRHNIRLWHFESALFELVVESVHPENLGVLPPSPDMLRDKAVQIGLTTYAELARMEYM